MMSAAQSHYIADVHRDIGLTKPVAITENDRAGTFLLSAQAHLRRRDRRVIATGELAGRQAGAVRNARTPDS